MDLVSLGFAKIGEISVPVSDVLMYQCVIDWEGTVMYLNPAFKVRVGALRPNPEGGEWATNVTVTEGTLKVREGGIGFDVMPVIDQSRLSADAQPYLYAASNGLYVADFANLVEQPEMKEMGMGYKFGVDRVYLDRNTAELQNSSGFIGVSINLHERPTLDGPRLRIVD